jgi:hypothetical protein
MAVGKNIGGNAQSSNDFLLPHAPTVTATDVGTSRSYNNGAIEVSFTLPADSPAATSYTASAFCSVHNTTHTATGSTSPLTITGFGTGVVTTVDVYGSNEWGDGEVGTSGSVTVTTVPDTPAAPTVSSPAPSASTNQAGATQDVVSWTAPANGGKSITSYDWSSSDGKSGNTTDTSVTVNQEGGTSQTYQVRANNDNGSGQYSSASGSVTTFSFTPFSFAPFGAFGFVPFSFTPFGAFSFVPFSFTPFGAFAFTPFNFVPFGAFAFTPFNFVPFNFSPMFAI